MINLKTNYYSVIFYTVILLAAFIVHGNAQAPQGIPYQAVARNASGNLIASQVVSVRFSIIDSIATGTVIYSETFHPTTNTLGLFNINIGQGTVVSGSFAAINWGTNNKFLKVELDPTGGNSYNDMGTTQMMSVPYALYSGSTRNVGVTPSIQSILFDDFIGGNINQISSSSSPTELFGELGWSCAFNNTGSGPISNAPNNFATDNHPGIVQLSTGAASADGSTIYLTGKLTTTGKINPNSTIIEASIIANNHAGFQTHFGIFDAGGGSADGTLVANEKIAFISDGTFWTGYTSDGTTQNVTPTIAVTAGGFDKLNIAINGIGTNAIFTVNGIVLGTLAIATAGYNVNSYARIYFSNQNISGGASSQTATIDYFMLNRTLTR